MTSTKISNEIYFLKTLKIEATSKTIYIYIYMDVKVIRDTECVFINHGSTLVLPQTLTVDG